MENKGSAGIGGWLLFYLIGSVPPLILYSMGLSGWFFEYPFLLMVGIFLLLAIPLVLIPLKSPKAPQWNIAQLWIIVVLMASRALSVFLFPMASGDQPLLSGEELRGVVLALSGIVFFTLAWATVWTRYFKQSLRVRNTFGLAR